MKLLITFFTLLFALPLIAGDFSLRPLSDGTAEISAYTGSSSDLTVPENIDGKKIIAVGEHAFFGNETLRSIVLSEGVDAIGEYVIQKGDTRAKVAKKVACRVSELSKLNPDVDWTKIRVGQKIKVPGVRQELVQIPAGTFMMGSPGGEEGRDDDETHVRVRISEPFYLGKTEVTQAQWKAVMGSNPSYFKGDNLPVECVSWDEAMEFCRKLTEREHSAGRLLRGWKYTLPTEAQWECACRAGTTTAYYTGGSSGDLARAGWYDANSGTQTHPVGQKMPNAFGLYDMHGNVWEWCLDWYGSRLQGGDNPAGAKSGSYRVIRGGSCLNFAQNCRSAIRDYDSPDVRGNYLGFRVALVRE